MVIVGLLTRLNRLSSMGSLNISTSDFKSGKKYSTSISIVIKSESSISVSKFGGEKRPRTASIFTPSPTDAHKSLRKSEKYNSYGERGSGLRPRGEVQDFYSIRDECLESGSLFEDPEFLAEDSSIFFSKSPPKPFEWKRPHEIADDPQLFIDGATRFDVKQGELDQSFGDNYAGVFHFRLHGSYEALKGGTTCEAMEDFTGGVSEIYDLTKAPANLFNIMLKAYERGSLMGCSVEPDPNVVEARCGNGLVRGHAYSVTRIKFCEIETPRVSGKIPLIRIRNPWGNEAEWNGPWSDQSEEWQFIPPEEREGDGT
ncbi:Calpain-A [Armadillidium nasatum]|uniref:Calpain-A n=1 Tax=Armadillidium nasatum TaxID=96803 RepID=A0A5N5TMN3_9CRUS|nr:Calpain-A [Armadillidium nasatum]